MTRFHTTRWSLILDARGVSPVVSRALAELCSIYRPPVLACVRRHGHGANEADDLTQAFFEQLLRHETFAVAERARGRFRTFLLVSLRHFLANQAAIARAAKRGGGQQPVSIEAQSASGVEVAGEDMPDLAFERDWADAVLRQAMLRLEAETPAGKRELFLALRPFLLEAPDGDEYARVAGRLDMRRNTLAVAIHRLRQRLHELVRAELGETVAEPEAIETELEVLRRAVSPVVQASGVAGG
jgi:RNA polymerase sigma-70 factor (ECF subfamily)